jgi:hypothetical protein
LMAKTTGQPPLRPATPVIIPVIQNYTPTKQKNPDARRH